MGCQKCSDSDYIGIHIAEDAPEKMCVLTDYFTENTIDPDATAYVGNCKNY